MLLETQLQKKDSTIVILSILFTLSYLFGIHYKVELYVLGLIFTTILIVLIFWDIRIFYLFYFISFFIQVPIYPHYPTILCLIDIIFPFFVIVRMSSYIYEGKSISSFIPDKKILYLLIFSLAIMIVSYLINFSGHSNKYQIAGIWAIYRMVQPLIVFILFSEKDLNINFPFIFSIFTVMTLIQIPVVISQAMLYDAPLGVSTFISGTFSFHHSGMGTFMIIMFFLTYYNYSIAVKIGKKILNIVFMCFVSFLMFVSASRSAVLGLLIAVFFMIVFTIRLKIKSILTLLMFLTTGLIFLYFSPFITIVRHTLFSPYSGSLDASSFTRIIIWKDSIKLFVGADIIHKIFGIGMYFSAETLKNSIFTGQGWFVAASHNNFLTALVETGAIGFVFFILLYGTILYKLFMAYKRTNNKFALSLFLMTTALLGSSITQETLWCHDFTGPLLSCYYFLLALFFTEDSKNIKDALVNVSMR